MTAQFADGECVFSPSREANRKIAKWLVAVDFLACADDFETIVHASERVPTYILDLGNVIVADD